MIVGFEDYKEKWHVHSENMIKPGLENMMRALALLAHPEKQQCFIHVAGTNGKGSTITFLEAICREHGLSVGKFMSPCIVDVHDQIQVNGQPISTGEMDDVFSHMKTAGLDGICTDFELLTCAAFVYFKMQQVDIVLLEAGMGGLLDSTNVITPLVSVIPSIALEHTNFLGNTIQEIAQHKAGIIKQKTPVVTGVLPHEAQAIVANVAFKQAAPVFQLGTSFVINDATFRSEWYRVTSLTKAMLGVHQIDNMAIAIQAFSLAAREMQLVVDEQRIRTGVATAKLAGRFEEVLPNVYFDGAHNPASIEKLVETINVEFPNRTVEFVVGMLGDKDVDTVLRMLETVSTTFTFVNFKNERAMKATELLRRSQAVDRRITHDIVSYLKAPVDARTIKVVTGSLYLLAELRQQLML